VLFLLSRRAMKHCISALAASSKSAESKLLLLLDEDARAIQVAVLCATRIAYFIYLLKLARLVTLSIDILNFWFVIDCCIYILIKFSYSIIILSIFFSIIMLLSSFFLYLFTIFNKLTKIPR